MQFVKVLKIISLRYSTNIDLPDDEDYLPVLLHMKRLKIIFQVACVMSLKIITTMVMVFLTSVTNHFPDLVCLYEKIEI